MRKQILTLTLLLTLALLPGLAVQAQTIELSGNADCEGWSANAALTFPSGVFSTSLDYSVVLTDQAGNEMTRFDWEGQVQRWEDPVINIMYGAPWDLTLDSVYTASFVFHFLGNEAVMNFEVVCGVVDEPDPQIEPCRYTYHYWGRHPDQWPVDELVVGGELLTKDELLQMLKRRPGFHPVNRFVRNLVAAQLNVFSGTDDSILPTIEAAEAFLVANAQNGRRWWRHQSEARMLRRALVQYNKQPCDRGTDTWTADDDQLDKSFADAPVSLGGLKAMYR